jgi:hypothetical protein
MTKVVRNEMNRGLTVRTRVSEEKRMRTGVLFFARTGKSWDPEGLMSIDELI